MDWSVLPEEQWAVLGILGAIFRVRVHSSFSIANLVVKGRCFPFIDGFSQFDDFRCPLWGIFHCHVYRPRAPWARESADRLWIHPATIPWARFKIDLGHKTMNYWPLWLFTIPFWEFRFWPTPFWTHTKIITRFLPLFACYCDPMVNGSGSKLWCVAANRVDQVNRVQSGSPFLPVGKIGGSCENHFRFGRFRAKPQGSVVYYHFPIKKNSGVYRIFRLIHLAGFEEP